MLSALDIVLIVLGSVFLVLTISLLLLGIFVYNRRRERRKQSESPFYADRPVHSFVHVEKNNRDVESADRHDRLETVEELSPTTVPVNQDDDDKKIVHRPQHIAIPSLTDAPEVTVGKALSYDTNIPIEEFCDRVHEYHTNEETVFLDEFEILNKQCGFNTADRKSMIDSEQNMKRNRFLDVLPFDDNRVKINNGDQDYINASFIDGYNSPRMFIATQGPLGDNEVSSGRRFSTTRDFWNMVWDQDVRCIVMLTQCVENCRPKCAQYWPTNVGESEAFEEVTVDLMSTTDDPICLHREFDVTRDGEKREISQFHFKEWEDAKAPESREHLLDFVERLRRGKHKSPILVHCSAGVGRTGVFIALFNLLSQLEDPETTHIDVYKTVCRLREQRVRMVQTPEQYVTLYDTMGAAITSRQLNEDVALHDNDSSQHAVPVEMEE